MDGVERHSVQAKVKRLHGPQPQDRIAQSFASSRLEARYAVLFQSCGLTFHYEREGFELEAGRYLADFWLPSFVVL